MLHQSRLVAALLALSLTIAADIRAQQAPPPPGNGGAAPTPPMPDKPMFAVARALLDALDAGEPQIREFVKANASGDLAGGATPESYAATLLKLREQSRGLELLTPMPGGGEAAQMLVRARSGEHYLGLEIVPDPARPDRFSFIGFHPMMSDPRKGSGLWVPEGEQDDAARFAHVERSVAKLVERDLFSGVVLVARGDSVLFEKAYGRADIEAGIPNTTSTRFHVGSIDKMFTAVAIAQLVERGALRFEDTLASVLPDYPNREAARKITIAQLLTHTAGVGDPFESAEYDAKRPVSGPQSAWFPLFANRPLTMEPGERHQYSNGGFVVLGAVIEKVTGQRYHDYVRDNVFRRAGMTDTEPVAGVIPRAAQRYYREPSSDPLSIGPRVPKVEGAPGVGVAMGGSYLTARDLYRFALALRENRLLTPEMTRTLVTGKVSVGPGGARYGYGFYDVPMGTPVRGHSGGGSGSGIDADLEILWDLGYTVVAIGNYDTPAARAVSQGIVRVLAAQAAPAGR